MPEPDLRSAIASRLEKRLVRLGLNGGDLTDDLDLVRSGVLDSLGFVDLIADLEGVTGKRVDLEQALERKGTTTMAGILAMFNGR